jgi:DnaJ-class molecular chaperone
MLKVHILATCSHCNGEAYQPIGEAEDCQGHKYTRMFHVQSVKVVVTSLFGPTCLSS